MKKIILIFGFLLVLAAVFNLCFNSPNKYLLEGSAQLKSGKLAKAIQTLNEGLKKYPDNSKISFNLAKAYLSIGEVEQANKIVLSKKISIIFKDNIDFQDFLVELSELNKRSGNEKFARFFADEYLKSQNTKEVSSRVVKNYIHIQQILPEKSIELLEDAFNIAHTLKKSELKDTVKALLLPRYFQISEDLKSKKKFTEALDILKNAEITGKNPEVSFQEALIYSEIEKIDLAKRKFEDAIQLDSENDNYKISYADFLKKEALNTNDEKLKTEYLEKVRLVLAGVQNDVKKTSLLNKIINLNAKYKITNHNLAITKVGDYFYPSLTFKIKPVSDEIIKKYKVEFLSENKYPIDIYEAPIEEGIDRIIEVTCRNPVDNTTHVNAKLFINGDFVSEYSNK